MLSECLWGNGAGGVTTFRPRGDDAPKGLGVTLEHIREGTMKCLVGLVACFSEATVGRRCKWVAWPLGVCCALPVLMCSETLGVEPGLDTFLVLVGVAGYTGGDW